MATRNYPPNRLARLIQLFPKLFFLAFISIFVWSIYILTHLVSDKSTTSIEDFHPIKPNTLNARKNITLPVEEVKNEVLDDLSDDSPDENMPDESKFEIVYRIPQPETTTKKLELETNINKLNDSDDEFSRLNYTEKELKSIRAVRECYRMKEAEANLQLFDDIEKSPPKPDKSIFFIHTTCLNSTRVTMNARQACSIESAAKLNPSRDVYVLFVTPVGFVNERESPIIAALKSYQNIHFRNLDIYELSKNTPAEQWIKQDRIFTSAFFIAHLSDYLRLIVLFKFGGIYQDLDFVNIKSFDSLPPNFAPQESPSLEYINNSVFGFESSDVGHTIVEMILRECFEKYDPIEWDFNGPKAIWRAVQKICKKTKMVDMMRPEFCWGFKITNHMAFFPHKPFVAFDTDPQTVQNAMQNITDETIALHLWSNQTFGVKIVKSESQSLYSILAKQYCPKAFEASGPTFK